MYTLYLNETAFTINSFTRSTYFNEDGTHTSEGHFYMLASNEAVEDIHTLAGTTIISLVVKYGNETVYNVEDANIKIRSIDENLETINVNMTVNIIFN